MSLSMRLADALARLAGLPPSKRSRREQRSGPGDGLMPPAFHVAENDPTPLTEVHQSDGRISRYPPSERWDDWTEWDSKAWPDRVARRYTLVPTICFNCEAACGLLAYVDKETFEIRKFEGNPKHPGSRGRNCAKGPATLNQTYDPERILYPLKREGARGEGKWRRATWDEALEAISAAMRASRAKRRDGIVYHVGRPGEDHYANRVVAAWGVDGHNSHTNVCSASARLGYALWTGFDRPSPDYANARTILLISSHLEAGHYFNPHAQRIMEARKRGARLIVMDPRASNTASKADVWMPTWPGSEATVLLAIARHLLVSGRWNKEFVRRWVDWRTFLARIGEVDPGAAQAAGTATSFEDFERALLALYAPYTFERAAAEAGVSVASVEEAARAVASAGDRLAAHVWRAAAIGNLGGWQVARCMFLLNVLTGSVGTEGGTSCHSWNKHVPKSFTTPAPGDAWNSLHFPDEWPLAHFEMSFLLPHMMAEGRGGIDVYFTRVYNPLWTNPDGFSWMKGLREEKHFGMTVALTPTWNETAWFADWVLPMGHAGERHDVMSQETHAGQWIGFRQPVRRVAMARAGHKVADTRESNPGEVWEESEFWVDLSWRIDPDGSLGIRKHFESPYRPGEPVTQDEYWSWIFSNQVPGLPAAAAAEGLEPLAYMRRYGCFEVKKDIVKPFEVRVVGATGDDALVRDATNHVIGIQVDGESVCGFGTPSRKLELFSPTLADWGWPEAAVPLPNRSHVHPDHVDLARGEMVLLPNFRLPTQIHTRSANAKWLVELSHHNPVWIHTQDAARIGVISGDLVRIETEIGWFVDRAWVTEGIKPGIVAVSHHLGRWRLSDNGGVNHGASALVRIDEADGQMTMTALGGAGPYASADPDTQRIWWSSVGVHQNLTHGVHPDPVSGAHCWLQRALSVRKARADELYGTVHVDTEKSEAVYQEWRALARPASVFSPDGNRRPYWLGRPLKPTKAAYLLPSPKQ